MIELQPKSEETSRSKIRHLRRCTLPNIFRSRLTSDSMDGREGAALDQPGS